VDWVTVAELDGTEELGTVRVGAPLVLTVAGVPPPQPSSPAPSSANAPITAGSRR
jgi:hypothetical protein